MNSSFRPLPLLGNPHLQTILGNFFPGPPARLPARLHVVPLQDGDALAVHDTTPGRWRPGDPVVILAHGLGGSHRSGYMLRLTNQLNGRGLRVLRVDLRGAGAGAGLARRVYNAACSADVRAAAEMIGAGTPDSPLLLAGISLGGNIVLKLAGEAADRPLINLIGVAAVAPPIDLARCAEVLASLPFYDGYYARNLLRQVRRHQRLFPQAGAFRFPRPWTMRRFDDLYTAPRGGFADALDYYRRASSFPLIGRIRVPTFILAARDDPFIPADSFDQLSPAAHLQIHVAERGGHLGFLGWDGAGGIRWAEQRLTEWLLERAGRRGSIQ